MDIKRTGYSAYNINYHFVFIPKYRRKVLVDAVAVRLDELLREKLTLRRRMRE